MSRLTEKYQLGARIGGGGMAEVLAATALGAHGFARPVAIKRVLPELSGDPSFGELFIREARIASQLHHPNIAAVTDFDRDDDGRYYLVMELVQGVDLRELGQRTRLPPAVVAHIISELLQALSYAHELSVDGRHLGIVHRDISPHNLMLTWAGHVKVVDFGIAKAIQSTGVSIGGSVKGKCAYMSPEQVKAQPVDGRSDLFAVGIVFHELLTGGRLFQAGSDSETMSRVLHQPIPTPTQLNPEVPADLSAVVMRLLDRDRKRRYRSARSALKALLGCASLSPRAGLDLQEILRTAFPERAPRVPTGVGQSTAPSLPPSPHPVPRSVPALGSTITDVGDTRSIAGGVQRAPSTWWIAGGVGFLIAAGLILYAALAGGGDQRAPTTEPTATAPVVAPPVRLDAGRAVDAGDSVRSDAGAPDAAPVRRSTGHRRRPRAVPSALEQVPARIAVTPWAQVTIDGTDHGTTPLRLSLPVGKHTVVLENAELGKREVIGLDVVAGRKVDIERSWSLP